MLLAILVFGDQSEQVIGHHNPEFKTQTECEMAVPEQIQFLKEHTGADKVTIVCVESQVKDDSI